MKNVSIILLALLLAAAPGLLLAQGRPVEVEISIASATNASVVTSTDFDDAVSRDVYSSLRLLAVEYTISGARTEEVSLVIGRASGGPAYKTVSVATNAAASGVSFETNEWNWIKPDPLVITRTGTTNAIAVKLLCLER